MNMKRARIGIWLVSALVGIVAPSVSMAQIISITIAPPALPVYVQPPIPEPGYLWTPGYWAYGTDGYFWVPGTWVRPPAVGLLWTPGYWGWRNGIYAWNGGYWGPHVGFYGGVSYGYGYGGVGYEGGLWRGGVFSYNSTVNNFGGVNVTTYSKTVVTNTNVTNVSFNGGTGGTSAQPTPQEQAAASEAHTPATAAQTQHQTAASTNKALLASVNHGTPAIAATSKPGEFTGKGVVAARDGPAPGVANTGTSQPGNATPKGPGNTPANALANRSAPAVVTPAPKGPTALGDGPKTTPGNTIATGPQGTGASKQLKTVTPSPGGQTAKPIRPHPPGGAPKIAAGTSHPVPSTPHPPGGKGPPPKKPHG